MRASRLRRHSAAIKMAAAAVVITTVAATMEPLRSSRTITAKWRVAARRMALVQGAVAVWKGVQAAAATMAAVAVMEAGKVCENECRRFASPATAYAHNV
jgi:hypothetical protein